MRLNKELRTKATNIRFIFGWIIFYAVIIFGGYYAISVLYNEHDEDSFPSGQITLSTNKERYQPKDTIKFTIKNNFPTKIYVNNNCPEEPLYVYKWQDDAWKQIRAKAESKDSKCYTQPRKVAIQPNSELSYDFSDWPSLFAKPGVYRIVMSIDHYDDLPYADFVVLKPVEVIEKNETIIQPQINQEQTNTPAPIQQKEAEQDKEKEDKHKDEENRRKIVIIHR